MSTNYYLRSRPVSIPASMEMHLCKKSGGWVPLFESHPETPDRLEIEMPDTSEFGDVRIESVADVRRMCESGDWEIYDEYGVRYGFDEFWDRIHRDAGNELMTHVDCCGNEVYVDPEGNEFFKGCFC